MGRVALDELAFDRIGGPVDVRQDVGIRWTVAELVVSKPSFASNKCTNPIVQTSTYVFIIVLTSSWLRLYRDSHESWPSFGPLGGTIWTIRLSRALATRSGAMAALS